jgi:sialate O-acetylesterase
MQIFPFFRNGVIVCLSYLGVISAFGQSLPFVHPLFSNNMVLQRNASDPVWGWTTPGAQVQVSINGQTASATANSQGYWQASVGPFTAGGPYTMQVTGPQSATFTGILFGEVFLCSGQSNMQFTVNEVYNANAEIADSANYPNIRCFTVPTVPSNTTQTTLSGGNWQVSGPSTTGNFTAVGYFTAREMYKVEGVPIGIINSSYGGTQIQSWVDMGVGSSLGDFTQQIFDQMAAPATPDGISTLYDGMIYPLAPFGIKAVIWYQGEFNSGRGQQYSRLLPGLMSGWRNLFGQPNLPFVIVQLPNNNPAQTQPVQTSPGWTEIREAQLNAVLADPTRTRIVTTLDIGEGQLHPLDKQDVGLRTSWAMENLLYGSNNVDEGPICTGETISGGTMTCTFSNTGGGLMVGTKNPQTPLSPATQVAGGTLNGFALAGADHVFYGATATITGPGTVAVSSPSVTTPVYIRYAWADNPICNLYNEVVDDSGNIINGIPAGSFRNDPIYDLNSNNASGGTTSYTIPVQSTVSAPAQAGETFHGWQGDTSFLSGSGSSATATLSQIYVSLFAYYEITSAPAVSAYAQVGQNVVQWSSFNSAHYNVKRATSANGPFTTIASNLLGVTTYTDTSIQGGATYYYTVSALSVIGEGPNATSVAVPSLIDITGLTATAGNAQVGLTWSSLSSALSYNVARATVSGGPYQVIASGITGTSYTDTSVVSGETYYYVVSATTSSGNTPVSLEVAGAPNFLPAPLQSQDIGTVGIPGSATVNSGTYTIQASGGDISGPSDDFRFTYVPITGDCTITAQVVSLQGTNFFAKGGVMLRQTLDPASPYAFAFFYGNQTNAGNQYRLTAGVGNISTGMLGADEWVRVVRSGNVFTTYGSPDGVNWTAMGASQTIVMPATIYAGLALTSHDNTQLNTTVFSNVSGFSLQSPAAPASLSASTRTSDGNISLSWNASVGALGYNVLMSTTNGGPYTTVASNINAVSYTPMGLTAGSTYYYVVSALTGTGQSANSNQVTAAVPALSGAPPAPLGLNAAAGNGQISLNWSGSAIATSYNIKRATQNGGPYTTLASLTTNSYTDTGLTNGTIYYYVVSAVAPAGEGANSSQISVSPFAPVQSGAIEAVNGLYVIASGTSPLIASANTIGSNDLFDLITLGGGTTAIRSRATGEYVVPPSGGANSLTATDPAIDATDQYIFTWTGLTFNMEATVNQLFVTAESGGNQPLIANRASAGSWETFSFIPEAVPVPPQNLSAVASSTQVVLTWDAMPEATGYNILSATTSGGPYTMIGTATGNSFSDTSMILGNTTYYVVAAVNELGTSASSSEVSALPGAGNVALNRTGWVASASSTENGGSAANAIDGNLATRWSTGASQKAGQWFQVDMGALQTFNQVILNVPNSSGDYPRGYQVNVSSDGVNWGSAVAVGTGASAVTTINLTLQTARYIRVTQTTTGVTGNFWSIDEFNVYYVPGPSPATPTGLAASGSLGQVALTWTTGSGAIGYNIKRSTTSGGPYIILANVAGANYADTTVTNGTVYYYVISALNSSAESPNSGEVSALSAAPIAEWRYTYFGANGLNPAVANGAADAANPADDGFPNLIKYALGMNPLVNYYTSGSSAAPVASIQSFSGVQYLTLTFTGVASDVTYTVQAANNLTDNSWTTIYTYNRAPAPGTVTVQDNQPISSSPKRFMRLQVTDP